MIPHKHLLIVLADGEHLRLVRMAEDNGLQTVSTLDSDPGVEAMHHSGGRVAPQRLAKEHFGRLVADLLDAAAAREAFAELIVVAPAHALAAICDSLRSATAEKIVGRLSKDLLKVPDHDLQPHLAEWVRPVRRADLLS